MRGELNESPESSEPRDIISGLATLQQFLQLHPFCDRYLNQYFQTIVMRYVKQCNKSLATQAINKDQARFYILYHGRTLVKFYLNEEPSTQLKIFKKSKMQDLIVY